MYAGFITPKRVVKRVGIHQRLDMAAYRMISRFLPVDDGFPALGDILHFEGYNGPDGLKSKMGLKPKTKDDPGPSHLYDPVTDTGEVPVHIQNHYAGLVESLKTGDMVRAAFEAAWMAHYVGDGLTPAHHWPLEEKIAEAAEKSAKNIRGEDTSKFTAMLKKNWAVWGAKGHMSTHMNFEMGIAFALLIFPIKPQFSEHELARARELGPVEYFKAEARAVASLDLYNQFGELKGRVFEQPKTRAVRPLSDKVRAALFDVVGAPSGLTVLDAYAGSGAAGFEAASRGAVLVDAIEANPRVARTIQANARALGLDWGYILHQMTVETWLASPAQVSPEPRYGLIIADPPYAQLDADVLRRLATFLTPGGVLAVSHSSKLALPPLENLTLVRQKLYGDTALSFYKLQAS
jgi:16S rRNA (guanine966-N2)-methyltransferase